MFEPVEPWILGPYKLQVNGAELDGHHPLASPFPSSHLHARHLQNSTGIEIE